MRLKACLTDDDAVSPVIGVILMVAITVILAAVIATFVLGIGEQVSQTAPPADFDFDFDESAVNDSTATDSWGFGNSTAGPGDGLLRITHTSGPAVAVGTLGATGSSYENDSRQYTDWSTVDNPPKTISAGNSIAIWAGGSDKISVRWESEEQSAILSSYDAPKS